VSAASGAPLRIAAGHHDDLVRGEVRVVRLPVGRDGTPREALLLRDESGTPRAYLNRCRHLPTTLDAGGRQFLSKDRLHLQCQTHGARYRLADGHCVEGPCDGHALFALALELEGDELYIVLDD
jgi:nitrite reductase/ring-hydroxylating ferredoxin subunit